MASIWDIVKKKIQRSKQQKRDAEQIKHPLDAALPFGLHVDGKILIDVLLPEGMSKAFPTGAHVIHGFSEFQIAGQTCFKVLLDSEAGDAQSYLWITQEGAGTYAARWFVKLDEIFPSSKDEWKVWIDPDAPAIIGNPTFESTTGAVYDRVWVPGEECIQPVDYAEEVHLDRYDAGMMHLVQHRSMLYVRKVEDHVCPQDEYALISAVTEDGGCHVSIDVGVTLDLKTDLTVSY